MIEIYTGNYDNFKNTNFNLISISGDRGAKVNFSGKYISDVAPKRVFWNEWFNNIGKIEKQENTRFYIRNYYEEVLSKIDCWEFIKLFDSYDIPTILMCYEKGNQFCHRHVLAEFIEFITDTEIKEAILENNILILKKHPEYIKYMLMEEINKSKVPYTPVIKPKIKTLIR